MSSPAHAPVAGIVVRDGQLVFDGHIVQAVAERAGATPFYAYSVAALDRRVALARALLPPGAHLHYAVKANPFEPLLRVLATRVDGADVASAGEMHRALACGFASERIGFAGPGKRACEIEAAIAQGVTVTAESELQLRQVAQVAQTAQTAQTAAGARPAATTRPVAALRVNPLHAMRASGMRMGGGASAFGIDEEAVPEMLERADALGVRIVGLHCFPGSQNLRAEAVAEAMRANAQTAIRLMRGRPDWQWLNLGGGLGVPYAAGEQEIDPGPIRQALADIDAALARETRTAGGGRVTLRVELGRYLVADAGLYVCRVLDRKVSRGRVIVVTDGGLHHNQAATGNFGQVIKRPYPLVNASRPDAPVETVDLVGPLCTPMDCFGRDVALAHPQPGDLIAVLRSGAYGRSASPGAFLGHGACQELMLDDDH